MLTRRSLDIQSDVLALPVHPLLAAAYPVVFLFAANAAEQISMTPLWLPLAVAVGGAAVVLAVLWSVTRDPYRSGLLTTVLVIGFFGYGHAWNAAADTLDSQWPFIVAWALLIGILLFAAWKARRAARTLSRFLNIAIALLLLVNVWSLGTTMAASQSVHDPVLAGELDVHLDPPDPDDLPDVYYIIPDRYGGLTALQEVYGHDNEPFLGALEERGFTVARHAHANYMRTVTSLTSTLSMQHLDPEVLEGEASGGSDWTPVFDRVGGRLAVPAALKELGYTYVHLGNYFAPTSTNVDADFTLSHEAQDEFRNVLLQTTLVRAFTDPNSAPDDGYDWAGIRDLNLWALDTLEDLVDMPGPKYVFGHLVITHEPYVHNEDGSFTGREQVEELGWTESYRRQLVYANTRLLQLVDRIIEADADAIIVLMSDEGPFPDRIAVNDRFDWPDATDMELEQKSGILYALRVPGADLEAEGFHDRITSVNAFRMVFNARFGTDLPLLEDRTYFYRDVTALYEWTDVTDRLR
jgi:hypothetical protein